MFDFIRRRDRAACKCAPDDAERLAVEGMPRIVNPNDIKGFVRLARGDIPEPLRSKELIGEIRN
jgi:hypothetical protein